MIILIESGANVDLPTIVNFNNLTKTIAKYYIFLVYRMNMVNLPSLLHPYGDMLLCVKYSLSEVPK